MGFNVFTAAGNLWKRAETSLQKFLNANPASATVLAGPISSSPYGMQRGTPIHATDSLEKTKKAGFALGYDIKDEHAGANIAQASGQIAKIVESCVAHGDTRVEISVPKAFVDRFNTGDDAFIFRVALSQALLDAGIKAHSTFPMKPQGGRGVIIVNLK